MRPGRLIVAALFAALSATAAVQAAPGVVQVQPSAAEVPANLLRISIRFAAPPEGAVLPRLALRHADGRPVQQPFLPQELWSPDGKILTILMHPGRVKTGLLAREEMGPILAAGDDVVLTLDGHPLQRWNVGPVREGGPMPSAWRLSPVAAGSKQALVVRLDGAIDGRDAGYLAIADHRHRRVAGSVRLKDGERVWTFTPQAPWRAGEYTLVARGTLEDPAGNRLGGHFETAVDQPGGPPVDAAITFKVDR
ncbi:hypothetical protein RugamoR57_34250 [Duganella caerulea]|uniref:hypothetical protein n=1 Tax=Duganella caerulea TaxID=2885762 RepID=UPI0030E7A079